MNVFTAKTGDKHFVVFGWWIRLIWGATFNPKHFRLRKFYGHRLLALRLWSFKDSPTYGRLIGIQWRRVNEFD